MRQDALRAYIGCVFALAVAVQFVVKGNYAPAAVLGLLAAFLIYWVRRNDGRGER